MKHKVDVNLNEAMFTLKCEQYVLAMLQNNEEERKGIMEMICEYLDSLPRTLNDVKQKQEIIDNVTNPEFWEGTNVSDLWRIRDELVSLMQYKQPEPIPQIVLNMGDTIQERGMILFGPEQKEEYIQTYQIKVEKKIKELVDSDSVIQKIKKDQVLTEQDLEQLEKTLNSADLYITEDNLKKIYEQHRGTLVQFIKKILGLYEFPDPKQRIKEAFSTFIIEKNFLNANQINFVRTLETVLISKKHIEFDDFFNPPFTNVGVVTNLFKKQDLDEIVELCKTLESEVFV